MRHHTYCAILIVAALAADARAQEPERTYFEFQVTKPARQGPGMKGPSYPVELRAAGTTGEVLAQFIVDTLGQPVMTSFKVLRSSHDLFTTAVRDYVATTTYQPAELNGTKVRQLVQQPFVFAISGKNDSAAVQPYPAPTAPVSGLVDRMNLPLTPAPRTGKVDGWMIEQRITYDPPVAAAAQTITVRVYGSSRGFRYQTSSRALPADLDMVALTDSTGTRVTTLLGMQKLAMVVSLSVDSLGSLMLPTSMQTTGKTDLGASDVILGRPTRHFRLESRATKRYASGDSTCLAEWTSTSEVWTADDPALVELTRRMRTSPWRQQQQRLDALQAAGAFDVSGSMPLRFTGQTTVPGVGGAPTITHVTSEVTELFTGLLDAALFDPPEGYHVMDVSAMAAERGTSLTQLINNRLGNSTTGVAIPVNATRTCTVRRAP